MPAIKFHDSNGKIILRGSAISCKCCYEMVINYDWSGTGQADLDTSTTAFGETVGFDCGGSGTYVQWIGGDDTSTNGSERVDVLVDKALTDLLWSTSYNVTCAAGWYTPAGGSGGATLRVTYKGDTKTKAISPGSQGTCASTNVATVTVYEAVQVDGSYFEIV